MESCPEGFRVLALISSSAELHLCANIRVAPRSRLLTMHRTVLAKMLASVICGGIALFTMPTFAQVAPSAGEIAQYSGLHGAAHRGDTAEIRRLIASGANLNVRDAYGRTPLHVATFAKKRDVVELLMKAGADHAALEKDRYDAVTIASVADDEATLRTLLANGASAKLTTSRYDGTALIAAAHLGHDGVVRQLIAAGAPIDHVNNLHWTAAIEAVVLGDGGRRHQASLKALIDAKANLQLADRQGLTPLALAKARGYKEMIAMLEAAGAK